MSHIDNLSHFFRTATVAGVMLNFASMPRLVCIEYVSCLHYQNFMWKHVHALPRLACILLFFHIQRQQFKHKKIIGVCQIQHICKTKYNSCPSSPEKTHCLHLLICASRQSFGHYNVHIFVMCMIHDGYLGVQDPLASQHF